MSAERPRAAIVVTGSELLAGTITDRNGPWLSRELVDKGFDVAEVLVVPDHPGDIESALRFAADSGADLIVTSGGLGPTADDLTTEIVARFTGRELELDEELAKKIEAILADFAARTGFGGPALQAAIRKQALVPRGAVPVDPVGTAPGLVIPGDGGPVVVVLPGPPRELQAMWPAALATAPMRELLARVPPARPRRLRFFGLPESEIAETLRDIGAELDVSAVEVTTCLRRSELEVDLRPRPGADEVAATLADRIIGRHARHLVSSDGTTTDELLARTLRERGLTVATAESCTGGLLAGRLTDLPGSSDYVLGGVVAYANSVKIGTLGVPAELIDRYGAVSPQVARAMADGVRAVLGADIGIGITGVAGPGGGTPAKPVGYMCFCVTAADGQISARDLRLPGGRAEVRDRAVDMGMHLLLGVASGRSS